jgi:hypothetical protein
MQTRFPVGLALLVTLALGACGGDKKSPPTSTPPSAPPPTEPIQAPRNTWTWVDFPDSSCGDGSTTGIGVNPGDSSNVLVFLEGGGACWSYDTCVGPGARVLRAFGSAEFAIVSTTLQSGVTFQHSVLDRAEALNPFRDWSFVYVPYCTGDVHAGNNVMLYQGPQGTTHPFHHVGHQNVQAFLKRLAATFPGPGKLVVSGTSAGGFGAVANFDTFRTFWPTGQLYLIDDSGPPLEGSEAAARIGFFDRSWNIYQALDAFCPDCRQDLSNGFVALSAKYPEDRISLLSYQRDSVIPLFFSMTPDLFAARLLVTTQVIDPLPSTRYFLFGGTASGSPSGHTLLRSPASFTLDGVGLWDFIGQQVNDSSDWSAHAAP